MNIEKRPHKKSKQVKRGGKSKSGGRPSIFNETTREIVNLLARRGFTDVEIAQCLKITERTLNNWKKKYPDFFQSLKAWKSEADGKTERSLYERACGYSCPETKAQWVQDKDGGRWEYAKLIKHYPPDPTSMIFWLKNRRPKEWRDKVGHDFGNTGDALTSLLQKIAENGPPKPGGARIGDDRSET